MTMTKIRKRSSVALLHVSLLLTNQPAPSSGFLRQETVATNHRYADILLPSGPCAHECATNRERGIHVRKNLGRSYYSDFTEEEAGRRRLALHLSISGGYPNPAGVDAILEGDFNKNREMNVSSTVDSRPKAPLVDSTLLRFLSCEQRRMENIDVDSFISSPSDPDPTFSATDTFEREWNNESVLYDNSSVPNRGIVRDCADDLDTSSSGEKCKSVVSSSCTLSDNGSVHSSDISMTIAEKRPANLTMKVGPETVLSEAEFGWLEQYSVDRVSRELILVGAEEEDAIEAGRVVQRYALNRTTRRRIQRFLRERDRVWSSGKAFVEAPQVDDIEGKDLSSKEDGVETIIEVLTDAGLTGRDIAAVFIHTPSVALMTDGRNGSVPEPEINKTLMRSDSRRGVATSLMETLDRTYFQLLGNTLKLRKYDARKVLRVCPGLLTNQGSKSAAEVISLMVSLGVSASSLAREKTLLPKLLSRSPAAIFRLAVFLSGDDVRMRTKSVGAFIRRRDCSALLDAVAPAVSSCALQMRAIADDVSLEHTSTPQLESVDRTYHTIATTAATLRRSVGIQNLASMVSACPDVLLLDSSQIMPVVEYLKLIGIVEDDVPLVLQSYPALIEKDLSSLQRVAEYLRSLGVAEESLGGIFRAFPSLFSLDVEKDMTPVVSFLKSIGVVNIGRFITRLPPVLGYSVERDLQPKWNYLSKVCKIDYFEVVRFPAFFSYPLERVIKTRYEYLRDIKRVPVSLISVDDVLRFGDNDFAVIIAGDKDGGRMFTTYARKRKEDRASNKKRSRRPHAKKGLNSNRNSS